MSVLEDKIHQELKDAQLARDELKVSTLRMLVSAIGYVRIEKSAELTDEDILGVVQKELKKRRESAEGFRKGGREEQAQKEESEAKILEGYLPPQMSDEELTKIAEEAINAVGATGMTDMGKVMGVLMQKVGKAAEPGRVSSMVKAKLGG